MLYSITPGMATGIGMGFSAIGSALGSFFSASGQKAALEAQANIAEINARTSENAAQSVLNQGKQQVAQSSLKYGAVKSGQKAALAANGVDIGTGNAAELQGSTDIMKEIDLNTLKANAVRSAWGYRTQSSNYQIEAMTKRVAADGISPSMSAGTTLLSSAGKVASQWYALNKSGAFDSPSNSSSSIVGGQSSSEGAWRSLFQNDYGGGSFSSTPNSVKALWG